MIALAPLRNSRNKRICSAGLISKRSGWLDRLRVGCNAVAVASAPSRRPSISQQHRKGLRRALRARSALAKPAAKLAKSAPLRLLALRRDLADLMAVVGAENIDAVPRRRLHRHDEAVLCHLQRQDLRAARQRITSRCGGLAGCVACLLYT